MKTHYCTIEQATESDNTTYYSPTACGLEYCESPMTDQVGEVTCGNCLKVIQKANKTHTFKTLIFKEGDNKGRFAYIEENPENGKACLWSGGVPNIVTFGSEIDDFVFLYPDIDFSQVELIDVEVTIK